MLGSCGSRDTDLQLGTKHQLLITMLRQCVSIADMDKSVVLLQGLVTSLVHCLEVA